MPTRDDLILIPSPEYDALVAREAVETLRDVIQLLQTLPIMSAASDVEPWAKFRMIDISKILEVAERKTSPRDWVSEYCGMTMGAGGPKFAHSPHHYTDYEQGRDPLRIPHYCNGEVL